MGARPGLFLLVIYILGSYIYLLRYPWYVILLLVYLSILCHYVAVLASDFH